MWENDHFSTPLCHLQIKMNNENIDYYCLNLRNLQLNIIKCPVPAKEMHYINQLHFNTYMFQQHINSKKPLN